MRPISIDQIVEPVEQLPLSLLELAGAGTLLASTRPLAAPLAPLAILAFSASLFLPRTLTVLLTILLTPT